MQRCEAINQKNGERCKNHPIKNSKFCKLHTKKNQNHSFFGLLKKNRAFLLAILGLILGICSLYPYEYHKLLETVHLEEAKYFEPTINITERECWAYDFYSHVINETEALKKHNLKCYRLKIKSHTNTDVNDFSLILDTKDRTFVNARTNIHNFSSKICLDHRILIVNKSYEWPWAMNNWYVEGDMYLKEGINIFEERINLSDNEYLGGSNHMVISKNKFDDGNEILYWISTAPELLARNYRINNTFADWVYKTDASDEICWNMKWTMNDNGRIITKEKQSNNWNYCSNMDQSIIFPLKERICLEN